MKSSSTLIGALVGVLALPAGACTGEFNNGNKNPIASADAGLSDAEEAPTISMSSEGQGLFESNVYDVIDATCSGVGCHSTKDPAFVNSTVKGSYELVIRFKDRLFQNFDAMGPLVARGGGSHKGVSYSADDLDVINAWLASERLSADTTTTAPSAMAVWSGCMTLEDWEEEKVADLWADKSAQGQGNCDACHNLGADGFMASNDSARVFEYVSQDPVWMPSYFTLDATGERVLINRSRLESVGSQLAPHQEHGGFSVEGKAMDGLQRFYDKTLSRQLAGMCGPPRF